MSPAHSCDLDSQIQEKGDVRMEENTNSHANAEDFEELGVVYKIPISDLKPHPLNPYHIKNDEATQELIQSIQKNGVLVPLIARKVDDGYQLIAGHRRRFAALEAKLEHIPVLVMDLSDDEAIIQLVDTNIQREDILPSEKAWAYKLRMDAMKRSAGRPRNDLSSNIASYRSDDELGALTGVSGDTIRNYISLTNLLPELLDMVDAKKIALHPAYIIASIPKQDQALLMDAISAEQSTPSVSQAQRLKKLSQRGELDETAAMEIMREQKKPVKNDVSLPMEKLRGYFPRSYSAAQIESTIFKLLDAWQRKRQREHGR